jgi:hypothetical protein
MTTAGGTRGARFRGTRGVGGEARLFGRGDVAVAVAVAVQAARWLGDDAVHEVATEFVEQGGRICGWSVTVPAWGVLLLRPG